MAGHLFKYVCYILILLLWIPGIYLAIESGGIIGALIGGWLGWMFFFVMKIPQVMWKDFLEDTKKL